jgi:hypothetical protein
MSFDGGRGTDGSTDNRTGAGKTTGDQHKNMQHFFISLAAARYVRRLMKMEDCAAMHNAQYRPSTMRLAHGINSFAIRFSHDALAITWGLTGRRW